MDYIFSIAQTICLKTWKSIFSSESKSFGISHSSSAVSVKYVNHSETVEKHISRNTSKHYGSIHMKIKK